MLESAPYAPVAQGIECWPPKPKVVGSNPAGRARNSTTTETGGALFTPPLMFAPLGASADNPFPKRRPCKIRTSLGTETSAQTLRMPNDKPYDAIIVGGGHNGLTCACYLAGAGLKVRLLERRAIVGGAATTEEFYPGFRNSAAAYTVSLLHPKVIRDLRLAEHGLRIVERPLANFLPLSEREYLKVGSTLGAILILWIYRMIKARKGASA